MEKSAGAVIFRQEQDKTYYLLLHYPSSVKAEKNYWDFPKGHIDGNETDQETAKREVKEECGIEELQFIEGFKESIKYFFRFKGKSIFKIVVYFLAETKTKEIKISSEHIGSDWLVYEEALTALSFKNSKEVLEKANEFLKIAKKKQKLF
ncbi:MAG: bis(5'-nucleosyl)-tetraphosphatase [bacterium]